jgi:hypothetical protein
MGKNERETRNHFLSPFHKHWRQRRASKRRESDLEKSKMMKLLRSKAPTGETICQNAPHNEMRRKEVEGEKERNKWSNTKMI